MGGVAGTSYIGAFMSRHWVLAASVLVFSHIALVAAPVRAEEPLTADQIATRMVRGNGFTWEGAKTKLRMVLIEAGGAQSERKMEVVGRRHDGLLQTKVRFASPSDVAGTAFLTLEKAGGGSEQHIYLPGLKRTRRIVGREREGSFMGSDFTYNDLERKDDKGATHVKLPDEAVGKEDTYVLETTPGSPEVAGYAKVRTWVRKSDFIPIRTRFFDGSGKVVKTLFVKHVRDFDGKPTVDDALMKSENGHSTELIVDSLERKDDLPDSEFSPTSLDR
jgi:hypothetical protein